MATIQGIYLALFGRPADPAGLSYFNTITKNGTDLSAISNLAGEREYLDRFSGMGNTQIINAIYKSLFGRDAESDGLAFWSGKLSAGELSINNIAIAILDGARSSDKIIVDAKLAAANLLTDHLDTVAEQQAYGASSANVTLARDYLSTIDAGKSGSGNDVDAVIARMLSSQGQAPAGGEGQAPATGGGVDGGVSPNTVAAINPGQASISSPVRLTSFNQGTDKIDVGDILPTSILPSFEFNTAAEGLRFLELVGLSGNFKYGGSEVAYFPLNDGTSLWIIDTNRDNTVQVSGANSDAVIVIGSSVIPALSDFIV